MEKKAQKAIVVKKIPSLKSIFELDTNNDICVVLKVKAGKRMDLIRCGYFRGTEDVVRVSKADYREFVTVTFFHKNEDVVYAFEPISDTSFTPLTLARNAIIEYVENELKIRCCLS